MKLRQCVFVAKDLESSREELCDVLGIEVAYRDPGVAKWGQVNVVAGRADDVDEAPCGDTGIAIGDLDAEDVAQLFARALEVFADEDALPELHRIPPIPCSSGL